MAASASANHHAQPPQPAWLRVAMLACVLLASVRVAYLAVISDPSAELAVIAPPTSGVNPAPWSADSGVRLASAEAPAVGGPGADATWLVDPDIWFAPEDPGLRATMSLPVAQSRDQLPPQTTIETSPTVGPQQRSATARTTNEAKAWPPADSTAVARPKSSDALTTLADSTDSEQGEADLSAAADQPLTESQSPATIAVDAIRSPDTPVERQAPSPVVIGPSNLFVAPSPIEPRVVATVAPDNGLAEGQLAGKPSTPTSELTLTPPLVGSPAGSNRRPPDASGVAGNRGPIAAPPVPSELAPLTSKMPAGKFFRAPQGEKLATDVLVKSDVRDATPDVGASNTLPTLALGADDLTAHAEILDAGTPFPTPHFQLPTPTAGASELSLSSPHTGSPRVLTSEEQQRADVAHAELFAKNCYPSAAECATCHKKQYEEWRISSHAYAFVSPMFHKFEQKISDLSQGTVGYFCQRCHSPVGTAMGMNRTTPVWEQPLVAREGVTCIACHRVNEQYSRQNGERRIVPGDITAPVYGGIGGDGVAHAIAGREEYKVKTSPHESGAGQVIHNEGRFFQQLSHAEFCTSCHQVAVHPGIKLEVVWDQYRRSPACKQGVTCQDCHMGKKPGEASGYELTSIAEVGGKSVNTQRKHANHTFYGPNYSIAHPGVFPHNADAERWRMDKWLKFDWRAGWGTEAFEDAVAEGRLPASFPPAWADPDDRYDARQVVDDNLRLIAKKRVIREQVMGHSLQVKGPFFQFTPTRGADLRMHYDVTNLNSGHNVLTASLGAQPQLWANVVLIGPDGQRLWETGYTDSNGDVCDLHSHDVRAGRMSFDRQLFNLQTMFLITGVTGTDRELPLPVNLSFDQLAFLRPGTLPVSVTNHPPFIRMESRSISPLGTKRVKYKVPGHLLRKPGRYRLTFRMRNRIEPIYFMKFCDATDEMVRAMNEGILDINVRSVEFWVK